MKKRYRIYFSNTGKAYCVEKKYARLIELGLNLHILNIGGLVHHCEHNCATGTIPI
jgi:hypothetical protein